MLTYVVRIVFVATFRSRVLTHDADLALLASGLFVAVAAVTIAHLTWHAGLRRYTGATS